MVQTVCQIRRINRIRIIKIRAIIKGCCYVGLIVYPMISIIIVRIISCLYWTLINHNLVKNVPELLLYNQVILMILSGLNPAKESSDSTRQIEHSFRSWFGCQRS